jgi:hypothetical protein
MVGYPHSGFAVRSLCCLQGVDELDQLIDRDGEELDALMAQMDIGMMSIDSTDHDKRNESESWMEYCPTD